MSNLIKHTVPVILVLVVCITCLVSPVSAASDDSVFFNVLDYGFCNETGTNTGTFDGSNPLTMSYSLPEKMTVQYIDVLFTYRTSGSISSVTVGKNSDVSLTVMKIDGNLYRAFGSFTAKLYDTLILSFTQSSTSSNSITINSLKIGLDSFRFHALSGKLTADALGVVSSVSWSSGGGNYLYLPDSKSDSGSYYPTYRSTVTIDEWYLYDYIDLTLCFIGNGFHSASAFLSDRSGVVPFTISYSYPYSTTYEGINYVTVHLDLSDVVRDDSKTLSFCFTSEYHVSYSSFVLCHSCYGIVDNITVSSDTRWYSRILDAIESLSDKFDEAFGLNDDSASDALETQEEINVSINTQLVGAVEDWNTHIEVVQTGYDSALTKATPALGWLASLADRVFTNMGWFGNIYFLIGLISVIMLVLSKSGLARSVGRIRRND